MKIDKVFSDKTVLPWQQHLSRYLENRSTYLNKNFTDLHHLSNATCSRLPITRMRNRDRYRKSMRGVSGFEEEESKR